MMVDGVFRDAVRPLCLKAGHVIVPAEACREPAAVHRRDRGLRADLRSCGLERLLAEFAQRVVAALEELAGDRQAGTVAAEPRGALAVVVVIGRAGAART